MYRKRTKDQWARDDPAFLLLLALCLSLTSILFALVLNLSFGGFVAFFLWIVFIDCIGVGLVVATVAWFVANRYLRRQPADQDVEWGYCFDVHLNAFFPMFVLIHVLMPLLFYGLIDYPYFFARLFGNSIWCAAVFYYIYITFLGYTALPILHKTHIFLYPLTFIFIFFVASVSAGWNISQTAMDFYHFRAMSANRNRWTRTYEERGMNDFLKQIYIHFYFVLFRYFPCLVACVPTVKRAGIRIITPFSSGKIKLNEFCLRWLIV